MALNKLTTKHLADNTIKSAKIADGAITDAKISESTTIPLSKTTVTGTQPTISSLSISQKSPSVAANVTITGTNFVSIPQVKFINQSTGARITASTVTYTSSTSLTVSFPAGQSAASYKVSVENTGGLAVQSTAQIINSDAPNWSTDAALGSYEEGDSVNIQLLAYDDDSTAVTGYTLQSGSLPSGITLSGDSTIGSLTGTAPTVSADTAYNFTIRATDNESQTTDKAFNMTIADYNIGNTLMFNDNDSAYLSRTPSGAGNRRTFTISTWVKRGNLGDKIIFGANTQSTLDGYFAMYFSGEAIRVRIYESSAKDVVTSALFRDVSAWYHIVVAVDTTQSTASDRVKIYINGSEAAKSSGSYTSQNFDTSVNNTVIQQVGVGRDSGGGLSNYFDGYLGETILVDGTALTHTSFGESNSDGVWIPKKYTGSYGTNGFLLGYDSSGSLGTDTSGNSNNWTANNLAATDQMQDSPHLNYATLNPLQTDHSGNTAFSQGNNQFQATTGDWVGTASTFAVDTGKWYAEFKLSTLTTSALIGVATDVYMSSRGVTDFVGFTSGLPNYAYAKYLTGGSDANEGKIFQHDQTTNTYGSNTGGSTGDIIGVALDLDNNKLYFSVNGTWENSANPSSGTNGYNIGAGTYHFGVWGYNATSQANFGSPGYTISSGNSDADGYGNFEYSVPTGYYALNSKNLATYG